MGLRDTKSVWKLSSKWGSKRLNCSLEGIQNGCHARCCHGPIFWPGKSGENNDCPFLGLSGCLLGKNDRPVTCLLFPFRLSRSNLLTLYWRIALPQSPCRPNFGEGPLVVESLKDDFEVLFGKETTEKIIQNVRQGIDPTFDVSLNIINSIKREEIWGSQNIPPWPRSSFKELEP